VKYADNLVVLAKEKMVLLNITGRLIEIVRYSGMDINVEKTEVMTISRQPFLVQIVITPKKMQNVEYLIYLGTMITNDARRTSEIKYRIATAQAAFNKNKTLFSSKLDLIWKKLVKCYIWSRALYYSATWILQTIKHKCLKSFEMSCRKTEISCTDHVKNEEVLQRVKEVMNILN